MPDFPSSLFYPQAPVLRTFGPECPAVDTTYPFNFSVGNNVWPSANLAMFFPVIVETHCTAFKMAVSVLTQSGNMDVGIYDEFGVALVRAGATAVAAAGLQVFDITDTALSPGTYYLAMAVDNATASFSAAVPSAPFLLRPAGVLQMASGYSTGLVTPATMVGATFSYLPSLMAPIGSSTL